MIGDVSGGVFLFCAATFFATSLVFLLGVAGDRNPHSALIGAGFVLLAACFVWLWAG